ncbi:hypothetical protein V7S43_003806 [Phytophthora oleae]|uniref:Uncharacterized protein n=1 Tax=Phytophthora oleae TaxID=2107226 RepID=A0ABD3FY81_9STRA
MTLPFEVTVCVNAIWKVLSSDVIKHSCYYHRVVKKSNATVAYAFGTQISQGGVDAEIQGNYSVCLFKDGERYVIALIGVFVPKKMNGMLCQGIVCHLSSWIELTANSSSDVRSSLSRSHCRFTVELDGSNANLLASQCLSTAKSMHEVISSRVMSFLEKVLVEEDWKRNGRPMRIVV